MPEHLCANDLGRILGRQPQPVQFEDIPQFPASLRDLAVVVDVTLPAAAIISTIKNAGGPLLKKVEVFDVYTGKPLPTDKKSVALSLAFQSPERTLTDKDTEKAVERIVQKLQQQHGAVLR